MYLIFASTPALYHSAGFQTHLAFAESILRLRLSLSPFVPLEEGVN